MAVAVGLGGRSRDVGDRPGHRRQPKDDALDSLLEKLSDPSDRADRKADEARGGEEGSPGSEEIERAAAKAKPARRRRDGQARRPARREGRREGRAEIRRLDVADRQGPGARRAAREARRDQGNARTRRPSARRCRRRADKPERPSVANKPEQTDRTRLTGKDKEIDEQLEELTGRKRRKKDDDGERSGPAGRDHQGDARRRAEARQARHRRGDPEEQKEIVKRIETLIEQMRQSGQSSMGRMVMRRVRRPGGRQPGQQPGETDGAMARGAPLTKPRKPTSQHSNAGGKDIWGHLPASCAR